VQLPINTKDESMTNAMMSMKKTSGLLALGLALSLAFGAAQAEDKKGDCGINYTRTACPGKDAESFAKCDGKASCVKFVAADSEQACQAAALKACANDRLDVTKSKAIQATYKGQPLKSASGQEDFCADYEKRAAEFDKCGK
jgi:hypothetical protein